MICSYLIALGSNRARPRRMIARGAWAIDAVALSPVIETTAQGPRQRRYANAVALVESELDPPAMLDRLQHIERDFGRRPGRRWGPRALDLDIIGWSGGPFAAPALLIPHPAFRHRRFVLAPLVALAPGWRDPVTRLTARQLLARLDRRRPAP